MALSFDSICARAVEPVYSTKVHSLAIHPNTSFVFDNFAQSKRIFSGEEKGHVYSRYANPTVEAVASKLAELEVLGSNKKARAYLTSSGMSAISTCLLAFARKNKRILISRDLYGGTLELADKIIRPLGIDVDYVDLDDMSHLGSILSEKSVDLLFYETPTNPLLKTFPLEEINALCREKGVMSIVDNTFCTAYIQQPLLHGADLVIYSATKYLAGHGHCTAGVVISCDEEKMTKTFWPALKLLGGNCSPFEAWNLNNGLKTLSLRLARHAANALALAEFLTERDTVQAVHYPFLGESSNSKTARKQMHLGGGMLSFDLKGGEEKVAAIMDNCQLIKNAPTLGDTDSLFLHPYSSSHVNVDPDLRKRSGVTEGLLRISVGLEEINDLKQDLIQAGI